MTGLFYHIQAPFSTAKYKNQTKNAISRYRSKARRFISRLEPIPKTLGTSYFNQQHHPFQNIFLFLFFSCSSFPSKIDCEWKSTCTRCAMRTDSVHLVRVVHVLFGFVFTFAEAEYLKSLWLSVRRLWRFCWCIFSPRKAIFSVAPPVRACSGGQLPRYRLSFIRAGLVFCFVPIS